VFRVRNIPTFAINKAVVQDLVAFYFDFLSILSADSHRGIAATEVIQGLRAANVRERDTR